VNGEDGAVSPVSRRRKATKKKASRRDAAVPSLGNIHTELVRAFGPMAGDVPPLDVELFASGLLGTWWKALPPDQDPDRILAHGAIEHAVERGTPDAMAFLRALSAVGPTEELRHEATAGAETLGTRGVAEPPWGARIGRVRVGECWRLADVYGDQASLYCEFAYGDDRHTLIALIDFNHLGGWVKDVWVGPESDEVLTAVRAQVAEAELDLMVLDRVEPASARRLLETGLAATDATWEPEVADTFRECRAIALARCRALPVPVPVPELVSPSAALVPISDRERQSIVAEFLASQEANGLTDADVSARCARHVVDFGAEHDGKPLRVSPARTELFLHEWLSGPVVLDDSERDAMPAVFVAWTRWAAARTGLPDVAVAELIGVAEAYTDDLVDDYDGLGDASAALYLDGVDPDDHPEVEDLERRMFAMPYVSTRIDDEEFSHLNPADPDDRSILIEGEHPEWHHVLSDPLFDGEADGVNPRLHLATHEIVANQLWDDDPPEAWRAAKRLLAEGVDRHEVLHRIGSAMLDHLHSVMTTPGTVEADRYRAALDELGRTRAAR
jgi:hypothetical protein